MGNTDKFDMIANIYDTPERVRIAKLSANAIREYLLDTKNKEAIDFGCGTGIVGLELLENFKSILFLDSSQNMIDQVKLKISDSNVQNAAALCFDFERGNLLDLHTDYIFMAQVLLHINDVAPVLSKLYGVLNEGGHLIIVDFDQNDSVVSDIVHNGFNQAELADMMSQAGFQDVQSRVFYTGSKIFMGQDASMFILDSRK